MTPRTPPRAGASAAAQLQAGYEAIANNQQGEKIDNIIVQYSVWRNEAATAALKHNLAPRKAAEASESFKVNLGTKLRTSTDENRAHSAALNPLVSFEKVLQPISARSAWTRSSRLDTAWLEVQVPCLESTAHTFSNDVGHAFTASEMIESLAIDALAAFSLSRPRFGRMAEP